MTHSEIKVRRFELEDSEFAAGLTTELGLSIWTSLDHLEERRRRDSVMLIAECSGRRVGFIVGRQVPASRPEGGLDAEIYNIGVQNAFQDSGVGSLLMGAFLDECRSAEVSDIWLEVRSANAGAIAFYTKFGFTAFAVRRNFYRDPTDDAIIMNLPLRTVPG